MADRACRVCGTSIHYGGFGRPPVLCKSPLCKSKGAGPRPCRRCGQTFQPPLKGGRHLYCEQCSSCGAEDCKMPRGSGNWCKMHEMRLRRHGSLGPAHRLPNNPKAGQGTITPRGYHRVGHNGKYRFKHSIVMESVLGRPLYPFENVHHKNGVRSDNRPKNLELWTKPQPIGQRPEDLAAWVVEFYPDLVREALERKESR